MVIKIVMARKNRYFLEEIANLYYLAWNNEIFGEQF